MTDLHQALGRVEGKLEALRAEHDRHAEDARANFKELREGLADLRAHKREALAEARVRDRIVEAVKWVVMLIVAYATGHFAGHR